MESVLSAAKIEELKSVVGGELVVNEPMSKHTSFGIGGPADVFVEPADDTDLATIMKWVSVRDVPWFMFGDGANLLVGDLGIRGVVIRLGENFAEISADSTRVSVGAGASLERLVAFTVKAGLSGLEYVAGIPGTVGGAIVMNAGTYRGQIGDVVESVDVITGNGERLTLSAEDIGFRYRWSLFQENRDYIITRATLGMKSAASEELIKTAREIRQRRNVNLPVNGRSAGCIFKNPEGRSAGSLIDSAGLKGAKVGDAAIAEKHANFILNTGNATADDVKTLAEKAKRAIKLKYDIDLEYEVRIVGEWKQVEEA